MWYSKDVSRFNVINTDFGGGGFVKIHMSRLKLSALLLAGIRVGTLRPASECLSAA